MEELQDILREMFRDLETKVYEKFKVEEFIEQTLPRELEKLGDAKEEVCKHLVNFFSRYKDKRQYKRLSPPDCQQGDILFWWPTKDFYYVKTLDFQRRYFFRVNDLIVYFKTIYAEEEKGNVKVLKKRYYFLSDKGFDYSNNKLNIYFDYKGSEEASSQKEINKEIIKQLQNILPDDVKEPLFKKRGGKTILEQHLNKYTKKQKIDYFIHKDLKNFLEKELDYYVRLELLKEI